MAKNLTYIKLEQSHVTPEQLTQIVSVEQADGIENAYSIEQIKNIYIEKETNVNFVCIDTSSNQIVAHIATNPLSKRRNGSIFVINLVVSPNYRRLGIAQKLIETACTYHIKTGTELPMSISVDKYNLPAINLYKKVGFEIVEPICSADEDDEQYILVSSLENLYNKMKSLNNSKTK